MTGQGVRVLVFTGKGGVGKTTTAAATAVACARAGLRTICLSTDPAHSLADAFGVELGTEEREVAPGLVGQQLDAQERMEESWGEIADWLAEVFRWAGVSEVEADELALFPGLEEIFALADIKAHATSGRWDVVVVDCAPTAETIRLLSLPDVLRWYMERVFPMGRRVNRALGPVLRKVSNLPVAGDDVFSATGRFYERLDGVRELLTDPRTTSVRLVVNPERMVIAEARRTYTYLSLYGYRVDAVVANRLLPDAVTDPWFARWRELHAQHLAAIEEGFAPLPVLRAGLAADELVGVERLAGFAAELYGSEDPASCLFDAPPMAVSREGADQVLRLALPFADHDDLEVGRVADELLVRVGPYRRSIVLPDSLRRRTVRSARLADGHLRVVFGDDAPRP